MTEFVEIFEDMDINNIPWLLAVCIVIIVIFAGCIRPYFASEIEIAFMSRDDELRRLGLICVILFLLFCAINYVLAIDFSYIILCVFLVILSVVVYFILWSLKKICKIKKIYLLCKENIVLYLIMLIFPIFTWGVTQLIGVNLISGTILCTLLEVIMTTIADMHTGHKESKIIVKYEGDTWYVFHRINENFFLCGDKRYIKISGKFKLLELETVKDCEIYMVKDNTENNC